MLPLFHCVGIYVESIEDATRVLSVMDDELKDGDVSETPYVLIQLTRWVRLRLRTAMWRQWKTPRRRRAALLELGGARDWPTTRPSADSAPGIWQGPKPTLWGFPMFTSHRSDFQR